MGSTRSEQSARQRTRDKARLVYREAILDAAEEELAASGFHATRVQDIARRAGVAVGTFYNYFETKEDVLVALLDLRMREMAEAFGAAAGEPQKWAERLQARLERVLSYKDRHAAFFTVAIEHGLLGDATAAAKQLLGGRTLPHFGRFERAIAELVDEGMTAGVIADGDPELYASFLRVTIRGVARWARIKNASATPREIAQKVVTLFLGGAGARARGGFAPPTRSRARASPR